MTILVFDDPPAVFIRVRKTGTTSLVRGLFGGAKAARLRVTGEFRPEWRERFTFAFVRNPYDRLVSCYEMFRAYPDGSPEARALKGRLTLAMVIDIAADERVVPDGDSYLGKLRQHALPMTHPSYHIGEAQFIGRFERFAYDYQAVRRLLGVAPDAQVPHARASTPRDYRDYFDAATRRAAERVFGEDLERFGYRF